MYDSSVKVPFIIKVPECEAPGSTCSAMAGQYDIFSLLSCHWQDANMSWSRYSREKKPVGADQSSSGKYEDRIVVFDEYSKTRMDKKGSLKYIHRHGDSPCEFYDLSKDPDEETNLFGNWNLKSRSGALR